MDQDGPTRQATNQLLVTATWQDGVRVISAAGRIDASNNHQLHAALSLATQPDQTLIADLSQVTHLSPHGLSTLLLIQRNADYQGARLVIVPSAAIADSLAPNTALTVCPDLRQALRTGRSSNKRHDA